MRNLPSFLASSAVLALMGCSGGIDCPDLLAFSVNVDVVGLDGEPLDDAAVVYSVDGGALQPCEDFQDGSWACGMDEAGSITVQVTWRTDVQTQDFQVVEGECNVVSQDATFTMDAPQPG